MPRTTGAVLLTGLLMSGEGCSAGTTQLLASDLANPSDDASAPAAPALDREIAERVAAVDGARIAATIAALAAMPTRSACSDDTGGAPGIGVARDFVRARFGEIAALQVKLDPYTQTVCQGAPFTRENVVAWLPGRDPQRLIVIGGHYDSRTVDVTDAASPAPGANDSGSQTALVLEAARVLSAASYDATLVFVAFAGEEQGLVGSAGFVAHLGASFPGARVEAALNCDIVGGDGTVNDAAALTQFRLYSPGTPREVRGPDGTPDDVSPSRNVMRYVGDVGGAFVPAMAMVPKLREDRAGRGGDHEPFIDAGIPGVRFIELHESLAHQHSAFDLPSFVTPGYTPRVTQVVVAVAASLARAPTAPGALSASLSGGAVSLTFAPSAGGPPVDHHVVAARAVDENRYRRRIDVGAGTAADVRTGDLEIAEGAPFYLSVAAVDAAGHESLFAYPELRCDATACRAPADAMAITARDQ